MANYKLPWNYEPGIDDALIALNNYTMGPYDYAPILTHYESKWSDTYCYDPANDAIIEYPYQINVAVHRANDTQEGHYAFLTEAEQLKTTYYLTGSHQFMFKYPVVQIQSDWNCYTAKSVNWYQLFKRTKEDSSFWVDTSSWSNTTLADAQRDKYYIPINTDINLSEEFRLRWYNYYANINNLTYSLPSTYFVENNFDNFAYSSTDNTINPKVYDSNDNLVTGALTRVNGQWILNLNATGTYHIYGYYVWDRNSLKPSTTEDVDTTYGNYDMAAWDVVVEVYNPSVSKVLSTDLYTYRQDGYDWLRYDGSAYDWRLVDALSSPQKVLNASRTGSSDEQAYTIPFDYLNDATWQTVGIDTGSLRGVNSQRSVKLHAILRFRSSYYGQETWKICFTNENIAGSTDSSLGTDIAIGQDTAINIDLPLKTNSNTTRGNTLFMWYHDQWEKTCDISLTQSDGLEFHAEYTSTGLNYLPYIKTSSQIWYY